MQRLDEAIRSVRREVGRRPGWAEGGIRTLRDLEREIAVLQKFLSRNGHQAGMPAAAPAKEPPVEAVRPPDRAPRPALRSFLLQTLYRWRMAWRSERVDDFGMDPVFFEATKPIVEFFYRRYFRVEARGLNHVPSVGRGLLVGNHSGVIPYDGMMVSAAVMFDHPSGRIPRFLAEDMFSNYPLLAPLFTRGGTVRACRENAERLLNEDQLVAVFPEGTKGIGKLYRDRYHLQRFGRGGFIHLALRTRAPIIPTAVVGAEESMPMIAKSDFMARLLGLPYFPITPNMLLLGPLGTMLAFPTKWLIEFGEPIELPSAVLGARDSELRVNRYKEEIRARLQEMINSLLKVRRSVWFG